VEEPPLLCATYVTHSSSTLAPHMNHVFPAHWCKTAPAMAGIGSTQFCVPQVSSGSTVPAALPQGNPVPFAGCAVGPSSALQWAVPPSFDPSTGHPPPVPPHPPLAFLDKNLFQYLLFLIVASTSEMQEGDYSLGILLLCLPGVFLAMRLVGRTPPSPGDPSHQRPTCAQHRAPTDVLHPQMHHLQSALLEMDGSTQIPYPHLPWAG